MPQLAPITLTKGDGTAVEFKPKNISAGVARLNAPTGVPIADPTLTMSTSQTAGGRTKVTFKLAVPVVQDNVVSGVSRPAVVRTAYADLVFSFDGSSTASERANILSFVSYMTAKDIQPLVSGLVINNEGVY